MELFERIVRGAAAVPDWAPLIVCPALLIVCAFLFALLGGRRAYVYAASAIGASGFALMCCLTEVKNALVYLAVYAVLALLLRPLVFLPRPHRGSRGKRAPRSRAERIYETFREELTEAPARPAPGAPEKVCCFEEPTEERNGETDGGLRLEHALSLLERLRREKLVPADRLEADVLHRTVTAFRGRTLAREEERTLNDCLASVLKLTAKYKL